MRVRSPVGDGDGFLDVPALLSRDFDPVIRGDAVDDAAVLLWPSLPVASVPGGFSRAALKRSGCCWSLDEAFVAAAAAVSFPSRLLLWLPGGLGSEELGRRMECVGASPSGWP